jgi:histidinol-phosphate aminotransferase
MGDAMKTLEDYFVPWLSGRKMYISPHIELAWREPNLKRMMSNENPLVPSEKVLEAINKYAKMANRYPDQGLVVRSRIAEINGMDGPENVLIGNGSSEVYDMIFRSFLQPGEEVIQHTPCFGIYKLRCAALGGELVSVPMIYDRGNGELLFDADAVINAITPKTKVVVIANPNNPTGNFMAIADFVRIAETGIPFIVDEAYIEFAGLERCQVGLTKKYRNVIITRTLSKAYGLAGLRFGYALGDKDLILQIATMLIPWNVGTIPMWAALAALEDTEAMRKRVEFNNREVRYIEEALKDVPGLTVFHSHGNYILFDGAGAGKKGQDMVEYAQKRGVILRPQPEMYGSDGFWRLTIGLEEENRLAVQIIKEFYSG